MFLMFRVVLASVYSNAFGTQNLHDCERIELQLLPLYAMCWDFLHGPRQPQMASYSGATSSKIVTCLR